MPLPLDPTPSRAARGKGARRADTSNARRPPTPSCQAPIRSRLPSVSGQSLPPAPRLPRKHRQARPSRSEPRLVPLFRAARKTGHAAIAPALSRRMVSAILLALARPSRPALSKTPHHLPCPLATPSPSRPSHRQVGLLRRRERRHRMLALDLYALHQSLAQACIARRRATELVPPPLVDGEALTQAQRRQLRGRRNGQRSGRPAPSWRPPGRCRRAGPCPQWSPPVV